MFNEQNTSTIVQGPEISANNNLQLLGDLANFKKRKANDHEHMGAEVVKKDPEITAILESADVSPNEIGQIIICLLYTSTAINTRTAVRTIKPYLTL